MFKGLLRCQLGASAPGRGMLRRDEGCSAGMKPPAPAYQGQSSGSWHHLQRRTLTASPTVPQWLTHRAGEASAGARQPARHRRFSRRAVTGRGIAPKNRIALPQGNKEARQRAGCAAATCGRAGGGTGSGGQKPSRSFAFLIAAASQPGRRPWRIPELEWVKKPTKWVCF